MPRKDIAEAIGSLRFRPQKSTVSYQIWSRPSMWTSEKQPRALSTIEKRLLALNPNRGLSVSALRHSGNFGGCKKRSRGPRRCAWKGPRSNKVQARWVDPYMFLLACTNGSMSSLIFFHSLVTLFLIGAPLLICFLLCAARRYFRVSRCCSTWPGSRHAWRCLPSPTYAYTSC